MMAPTRLHFTVPACSILLLICFQAFAARTARQGAASEVRISAAGPVVLDPAVAYNSTNNEYLVVWQGTIPGSPGEKEIFGQRINAATRAKAGTDAFRISDMGPDGDAGYEAAAPAVAYNSVDNEYLVVWSGTDNTAPLAKGEREIFGQRINATGAEVGVNDIRISDMGPDGNVDFRGFNPKAVYNSANNEYLVVWSGDDESESLVDDEFEIFGQRINAATGGEVGANDFRISDAGIDRDPRFGALTPAVAWNRALNEYLVVWSGDDNRWPLINGEIEIFGQRINALTGAEVGANDFRISDMGPDGKRGFNALAPAVAWNARNNEYLVAWSGDDDAPSVAHTESEIYGQRIHGTSGADIGLNDFRISNQGPDADNRYDALAPTVAYSETPEEYLVLWHGNRETGGEYTGNLFAIFGQRVNAATGAEIGANDFQVSAARDGNGLLSARTPAIAWGGGGDKPLAVWRREQMTERGGWFDICMFGLDREAAETTGARREAKTSSAAQRAATALEITEATPVPGLKQMLVTARLTHYGTGDGLRDQTVVFRPGDIRSKTGSSGLVTVRLALEGAEPHRVTAVFGGDATTELSFATATLAQKQTGECAYAVRQTSEAFPAVGGYGNIGVVAVPGVCAWSAQSDQSNFIVTAGATGNGFGTIRYAVAVNQSTASARRGTITVAGLGHAVMQGAAFLDVPPEDELYTVVGKLSARGVTTGCGGGKYCPEAPITRQEMAGLMLRALGETEPPRPSKQRFDDVPETNFFYPFIDRLAGRRITTGCNPPTNNLFCPGDNVSREQMAAFLLRAMGETSLPAPSSQRFKDVLPESTFAPFIEQLAVRRIAGACNPPLNDSFCPARLITRGETAALLVRAFGL